MIYPVGFDHVQVITAGLQLTIVTGAAEINWKGDRNDDFDRDDLVFLVPADDAGNPLVIDRPNEQQMAVMVYPATIENRGGANFGWGVDNSAIQAEGRSAKVTARVVVEGQHSYFIRVGFLVIITLQVNM
jgi:hypothetical protein